MSAQDVDETLPGVDWEDLLLAYLHDPFDKALDVQRHEQRAAQYASAALGKDVSRRRLHRLAANADVQAAMAERVPAPTAKGRPERAVGPADRLRLVHPMSGEFTELDLRRPASEKAVAVIKEIVRELPDPRLRFLAVWRLLPDRLAAAVGDDFARMPADTRIPDHTLFQHADITAGLHAARANENDAAYLSFALGPVQPFIAAARSVRDLWSGSAILSWLAFQAMTPILTRLGPTAFVYPALRGAPLVDLWLRRDAGLGDRVAMPPSRTRLAPSLPHRFVALVPWGASGAQADAMRRTCLDAVRAGWQRLATMVRTKLAPQFAPIDDGWSLLWDRQIESAFDFRITVAPQRDLDDDRLARLTGAKDFASAWPAAAAVRGLGTAIPVDHRPGYEQNNAGRWQAQMELVTRLMAAARSVRHVPESTDPGAGPWPGKCSLFGSWEQMGPAAFGESRRFWERAAAAISVAGVRLRSRERLCAVALTKRFAGPALLASELGLSVDDLRFPDTPTVAAAAWLNTVGIDPEEERRRHDSWSGLWLHWRTPDQDPAERPAPNSLWRRIQDAKEHHGSPPAYYAVLAMDGDEMGRWLAGQKTPEVRRMLHPKLRTYFEGIDSDVATKGLAAKRPVGPALHAAISAALAAFATEIAPQIVATYHGTMIYSGGDDILALCPVSTSLNCACALRDAFSGRDDPLEDGWRECGKRRRITMGARASTSAGIAIVHFMEDLRHALETARDGEQQAKNAGRNRLALVTARRSGETACAISPWSFVLWLDELRRAFVSGTADRWTYSLRRELPTLASDHLPREAMRAEIRRLVDRGADNAAGHDPLRGADIASAFDAYCRCHLDTNAGARNALRDFVTLCQSASFMARGSDD